MTNKTLLIEAEEWTGIIEPEYSLFDIQLGHITEISVHPNAAILLVSFLIVIMAGFQDDHHRSVIAAISQ